jgi:Fe2+ transport system protein FeoA
VLHLSSVSEWIPVTLDQLPLGHSAKVVKLTGAPAVRRRLMEMGITPAATIEAVRRAPLGDPLDIKVRGYHLSLRKEEAAAIEVSSSPLPPDAPPIA